MSVFIWSVIFIFIFLFLEWLCIKWLYKQIETVPSLESYGGVQDVSMYDPTLLPGISINLIPPTNTSVNNCNIPILNNDNIPCSTLCNDSDASEFIVEKNDSVYAGGKLNEGKYCVSNHPPDCNSKWGALVFGAGTWNCIPLYPDIVGGPNANVPNFLFLDSDTTLAQVKIKQNEKEIYWNDLDPENRDSYEIECGQDSDGFKLVRLDKTFKCIRDPCETIPFTDSFWNQETGHCECGPNQVNEDPNDPFSKCIPSNYSELGSYDPNTSVAVTEILNCVTASDDWTKVAIPCPDFSSQVSTVGYRTEKFVQPGSYKLVFSQSGWLD